MGNLHSIEYNPIINIKFLKKIWDQSSHDISLDKINEF